MRNRRAAGAEHAARPTPTGRREAGERRQGADQRRGRRAARPARGARSRRRKASVRSASSSWWTIRSSSKPTTRLTTLSKAGRCFHFPALCGVIGKPEDVDWLAVAAKAGQWLTFSVWANRLEDKIHDLQTHFDPILQLFDAAGRELAADDNHDFADPMLSYEFKQDGVYYVQIRDTTYGGNANWTYVMQATGGPVATAVFPLAVNPGKPAVLHASGPNVDPAEALKLDVPADLADGPHLFALPTAHGATLATPVVVTSLPIVVETNDAAEKFEKATRVTLPAALTGRLDKSNDVDAYRFAAKKGQIYAFEVVSRRRGPRPTRRCNWSTRKTRSWFRPTTHRVWGRTAAWNGPRRRTENSPLVVSDLHSRGGEAFGYALLAAPAQPDFTIACDPDKLNVGPGGRIPLFVQITRRAGFDGPVAIDLGTLPAGVSVVR